MTVTHRYPDLLLCLSTCPDAETAARIARALVEERLAACVNRLPDIKSTYRWQGEIHEDNEVLLVIKTTGERLDALRERLAELHPYALPELVAVEITDGLPALSGLACERERGMMGGSVAARLQKWTMP